MSGGRANGVAITDKFYVSGFDIPFSAAIGIIGFVVNLVTTSKTSFWKAECK